MARQPTTKKKTPVVPSELGVKQSSVYDYDYCLFDINKDLKFPYSIQTYKEMRKNINIASALNAVQIIALRVPRFIDPSNDTDTHKKSNGNKILGCHFTGGERGHTNLFRCCLGNLGFIVQGADHRKPEPGPWGTKASGQGDHTKQDADTWQHRKGGA